MNVKLSHLLSLSRSHQQGRHHFYHRQQNLNSNSFSFNAFEFFVNKLEREFPSVKRRIEYFKSIQNGFKMVASFLGRECSPIVAQRAFRGYRMLQLHSKLWSYCCTNPVTKRALFSFVIMSLCQANDNLKKAIVDAELAEHLKDLEYIRELTAATVVCSRCKDRLVIDKKVPGVQYCRCPGGPYTIFNRQLDNYPWIPFAETADLLIWRQPHPHHEGLYIYKVYGYYNDISAQDFLDAQLDIEYRKVWDDTALQLEVVESFPETQSDIIYWEMKWPRMFSNRDYLYIRRHKVEKDGKNMVIMSKAVTHPKVPERKGIHRVTEYWSVMHIKAAKGISQPGVEFGLTYFDNPGVSLPQWLTSWAAMSGIPDFLDKQRIAARVKRRRKEKEKPKPKPKSSIAVSSSKSHFSDKKKTSQSTNPPPGPTSPPPSKDDASNKELSTMVQKPSNITNVNDNSSSNNKTGPLPAKTTTEVNENKNNNITSNNTPEKESSTANTPPQLSSSPASSPSTSSQQPQQEGKTEVLSQFFKEHILEVQS